MRFEFVRSLSRLALLLLWQTALAWLAQPDVPKWSIYEIDLTASGSSSNWYTDPNASLTATFSGPGEATKR